MLSRSLGSHNLSFQSIFSLDSALGVLIVLLLLVTACSRSVPAGKDITASKININDYWFDNGAGRLQGLMKGDVESFYNLHSKYPTDLEMKVFRKSGEPERLRREMKKELESLLHKTYVMEIGSLDLYGYDLKKKAFRLSYVNLRVGGETGSPGTESRMINDFWFEELPFTFETDDSYGHHRGLYLRVNEEMAMKLGKSDNVVYLIFNVRNSLKNDFVRTKDVGLLLVDKVSWSTLYAVKFADFDENKVWIKK